jgi:hypothetical protein
MTTAKVLRPANAGAITRSLVSAGFVKGEERKASRGVVRGGWSTFTEGVVSEQVVTFGRRRVQRGTHRDGSPRMMWVMDNTPTGFVKVRYQFSRASDSLSAAERHAKALRVLTAAAEHLTAKGFAVEVTETDTPNPEPLLRVCRYDADNNVVVF